LGENVALTPSLLILKKINSTEDRITEEECQRLGIRLFVLPPKSPKLNGSVERAHRTHTEEFYEVYECSWTVPELNQELRQWEHIYNCVRPHQALGYKTLIP
jgi:putative transposase